LADWFLDSIFRGGSAQKAAGSALGAKRTTPRNLLKTVNQR
jgi:hypothetical protein